MVGHPGFGSNPSARLGNRASNIQGRHLYAVTRHLCLDDAGREASSAVSDNRAWSRRFFSGLRQYSAHGASTQARRLRLGSIGIRCWIWGLDVVVWIIRRGRSFQHVPGNQVGQPMGASWLARGSSVSRRICRFVPNDRLAPRPRTQESSKKSRKPIGPLLWESWSKSHYTHS